MSFDRRFAETANTLTRPKCLRRSAVMAHGPLSAPTAQSVAGGSDGFA
jgi:hypothetical protein